MSILHDIACGKDLKTFLLVQELQISQVLSSNLPFLDNNSNVTFIFQAIVSLWIISVIGSYCSTLSLLYFGKNEGIYQTQYSWSYCMRTYRVVHFFNFIGFLCLHTLPVLYEQYEGEIDHLAARGSQDLKKILKKIDSKVLNKIPRAPVKDKSKKHKWADIASYGEPKCVKNPQVIQSSSFPWGKRVCVCVCEIEGEP